MKFDEKYCFLSDVGNGEFCENSLRIIDRTFLINDKEYKDPDGYSEKLYSYHKGIWDNKMPCGSLLKKIEITNTNGYKITAKVDNKNLYLGSDYIGFSKNWTTKEMDEKDIENALMVSRTFGGHILFAKGFYKGWFYCKKDQRIYYEPNNIYNWYKSKYPNDTEMYNNLIIYTINTAKGGKNSFYDRFDWTLILLKIYFECINETNELLRIIQFIDRANIVLKQIIIEQKFGDVNEVSSMYERFIKIYYGLDNSREWLAYFNDFIGFANYFSLHESFVDDKNNIIKSAPLLPILPTNYGKYMNTTNDQIVTRNKKLFPMFPNEEY